MDELERNLNRLENFYGEEIKSALIAGGLLVESTAKQSIQKIGMGTHVVRYRNGGGKKNHIAAKPGIAPNTDTGRLVSSISTEIEKDGVFVGSSLEYAAWLEFGTLNKEDGTEHNAARPFLNPALDTNRDKINKLIISAVKEAINKSTKG